MNNLIQDQAETKDLNYEKSFRSTEGAETNEGTVMSTKDPDTMISVTLLLLACLALAVLAHAVI